MSYETMKLVISCLIMLITVIKMIRLYDFDDTVQDHD